MLCILISLASPVLDVLVELSVLQHYLLVAISDSISIYLDWLSFPGLPISCSFCRCLNLQPPMSLLYNNLNP